MSQDQNNISESLQKLQDLLQKLFRADAADLDFGIYRVINHRREAIQDYIDKELPKIVQNALDSNTEAASALEHITKLESEVQDFSSNLGEDILDVDGNLINENYKDAPVVKKYLKAKENLGSPQTPDQRSDNVFNHLYTFFSRYYDNGDFVPRRRYAQTERYAVPYNGEEVYLHWANRDQYYVKSGEHFSNYRFKPNPKQNTTVTFDLQNVDIEKDNVKGVKRFFIPLSSETKYNSGTDEVCIPFEYRPLTDAEKSRYGPRDQQEKIIDAAELEIMENLANHYNALSALDHQINDGTSLKKHLRTYTRRNTADFFIHKNLKQFLNSELDVYVKNEVIPMSSLIFDDVNFNDDDLKKVNWIETSKIFHRIAAQVIDFLAHIEEFQKRLWLKKKFVLSTDYCLTLDRVPEELYTEITQNTAQLEEWKDLFTIHEIDSNLFNPPDKEGREVVCSVEFLKENPNLVLDTCHFTPHFKDRLLSSFDDLDNATDGLLIHGENFQALNLLTKKYRESIKSIYIDPPYNTDASAILYKNNYKDSSWMSLMADRLALSREFLSENGIICVAIDDVEVSPLRLILEGLFEKELGIATVRSNPQGRARTGYFSPAHEYALFYGKFASLPGEFFKTEKQKSSYPYQDEIGKFAWDNLIRRPPGDNREDVPTMFYPIYVRKDNTIRIPKMVWNDTERFYDILELPDEGEVSVLPIKSGKEKRWRHGRDKVSKNLSQYRVIRKDKVQIEYKSRMKEMAVPKTWWDEKTYAAGRYGTTFLENMFKPKIFNFPKSVYLVSDCLRACALDSNETVLDYFGGSGTTGHAVISLNRQDSGKRKYILIEMGHHFDSVLKPRIKKAVYAEKWKNAKPASRDSRLSHIIKYQRIESYEDALNNIELNETDNERVLLTDEHQLSYMLESDTKESPTLLNISELQNPFSYQLDIVKDMQTQTETIDLPETFNYLFGLSVQTRQCLQDDDRRYLVYKGIVEQKSVVIIWRETAGWKKENYERDYQFIQEQELIEGMDEVYINTCSNIPDAKSLDPLFKRLMFSE